jgi:predicted nucleotidyltransferase
MEPPHFIAAWRQKKEARRLGQLALADAARQELDKVVQVLTQQYGATRVILFGSLVRGRFGPGSDIDITAEGLPGAELLRIMSAVNNAVAGLEINLSMWEDLYPHIREQVLREGELLFPAPGDKNVQPVGTTSVLFPRRLKPLRRAGFSEEAIVDPLELNEIEELAHKIENELAQLRRVEAEVAYGRERLQLNPIDARIYYNSLALKLHDFYNGCERIFKMVASELDQVRPTGEEWHKELLRQAAQEPKGEGGRPAVISAPLYAALEEFLRFRHVVRNLYSDQFDPPKMDRLLDKYPGVSSQVQAEVAQFVAWLDGLEGEEQQQ